MANSVEVIIRELKLIFTTGYSWRAIRKSISKNGGEDCE